MWFWKIKRDWSWSRRIQDREFKTQDLKRELSWSTLTGIIFGLTFSVAFVPEWKTHTAIYSDPHLHGRLWLALSLPLLILVHDAYFYWMHRMVHHPRWFKLVHQVHHRSTNPSPFAAYAFHPLETGLEMIWILPVLYFVPLHRWVVLAFGLISLTMNVIGHLGFELYPSRWKTHAILKWLNTPTLHNEHHRSFQYNFGLYFSFWDSWCGTLSEPKAWRPK